MADWEMNSVHLEQLPRREEFRRARARLRSCCGDHTVMGDIADIAPDPESGRTCVHLEGAAHKPADVACCLKDGERVIPLHVGLNSIGRLPDNDVVLADASVSRRHCAIVVHSDLSCEIHDTASKNGTLVNGRRIAAMQRLGNGDVIDVCDHRLEFHLGLANSAAPPAPSDRTQVE